VRGKGWWWWWRWRGNVAKKPVGPLVHQPLGSNELQFRCLYSPELLSRQGGSSSAMRLALTRRAIVPLFFVCALSVVQISRQLSVHESLPEASQLISNATLVEDQPLPEHAGRGKLTAGDFLCFSPHELEGAPLDWARNATSHTFAELRATSAFHNQSDKEICGCLRLEEAPVPVGQAGRCEGPPLPAARMCATKQTGWLLLIGDSTTRQFFFVITLALIHANESFDMYYDGQYQAQLDFSPRKWKDVESFDLVVRALRVVVSYRLNQWLIASRTVANLRRPYFHLSTNAKVFLEDRSFFSPSRFALAPPWIHPPLALTQVPNPGRSAFFPAPLGLEARRLGRARDVRA
jgi:hypothetical protein